MDFPSIRWLESDVFGGVNATDEMVTEPTDRPLERPERPEPSHPERPERPEINTRPPIQTPRPPVNTVSDCNASTPTMRVTPQEIHHHHHHYLPEMQGNCGGGGAGGSSFGGGNSGNVGNSAGTGTGTPLNDADRETIQSLTLKLREVMATVESLKTKVVTLSDVVDELINNSGSSKLLLTGAKLESTTNLFELVRHVILDLLDLKDLRNDIYSATRTKEGVVFDVASGLDKRRILARARERFLEDDWLRIQDYYDVDARSDTDKEVESLIDVRFGADDDGKWEITKNTKKWKKWILNFFVET